MLSDKILSLPRFDFWNFCIFWFLNKDQDQTNCPFFFKHFNLSFSKLTTEKALPDICKLRSHQVMISCTKSMAASIQVSQTVASIFKLCFAQVKGFWVKMRDQAMSPANSRPERGPQVSGSTNQLTDERLGQEWSAVPVQRPTSLCQDVYYDINCPALASLSPSSETITY